jgi:hypothetical protein
MQIRVLKAAFPSVASPMGESPSAACQTVVCLSEEYLRAVFRMVAFPVAEYQKGVRSWWSRSGWKKYFRRFAERATRPLRSGKKRQASRVKAV